jgi:hypothetical protein
MKTVSVKQAYEAEFDKWSKGGEFEGITDRLDSLYDAFEPYAFVTDYYNETAKSIEIGNFAMSIARLFKEDGSFDCAKAAALAENFFKDYHMPIDKEIFVAMMDEFDRNIPEEFKPEFFRKNMHHGAARWAESIYGKSLFTDASKV